MDQIDREIVRIMQEDASLSARELGEAVGLTATPCWRRVQNLQRTGVLIKQVALVDPLKINLGVSALVQIRTNEHSVEWLEQFSAGIADMPEIVEAFRTSGEIDYILRVVVPDIAAYDAFYKRLIERVDLYDVRSIFVMEEMKRTTRAAPRLRRLSGPVERPDRRCRGNAHAGYLDLQRPGFEPRLRDTVDAVDVAHS